MTAQSPQQQAQLLCIFSVSANSKQGQCLTEETSEVPRSPESQEASPIYTVAVDVLGPVPNRLPSVSTFPCLAGTLEWNEGLHSLPVFTRPPVVGLLSFLYL